MERMWTEELVMCVRNSELNQESKLEELLELPVWFAPRGIVDKEPNEFRQVIPYVVLENEEGKILTYRRKGSEKRLHNQASIGFGGHITIGDFATVEEHSKMMQSNPEECFDVTTKLVIERAARREVWEEIGVGLFSNRFDFNYSSEIILFDEGVHRDHVGVIMHVKIRSDSVRNENMSNEIASMRWIRFEELEAVTSSLELWSQHALIAIKVFLYTRVE